MDATSRFQQQIYADLKWFYEAYERNKIRPSNTAWKISIQKNARSKSSETILYKEAHPTSDGFIDDYQLRLMNVYRSDRKLKKQLSLFKIDDENVEKEWQNFQKCFDRLEHNYNKMVLYVHDSVYTKDNQLTLSKAILDSTIIYFNQYSRLSKILYYQIKEKYEHDYPPLKTQQIIRNAQTELLKSTSLLENWESQLYNGNDSFREQNDAQLRLLNTNGLQKSKTYLSNTYGYDYLSNGALPHSRYDYFFKDMQSTIFWFIADTSYNYKYLPPSYDNYNKFVNRYNAVMQNYNQFIECADGTQSSKNMDYSKDMAAKIGVDTAENILLKKPRIGYIFAIIQTKTIDPIVNKNPDTTYERRSKLIAQAQPHHTIYLLDISNSMLEYNKLDTLKLSMKYLIQMQRLTDYISVIAFADKAVNIIDKEPCDNKEMIYHNIDGLKTNGATNAEDAIIKGYEIIDSNINYKGIIKMVIITDGQFTITEKTKKKIAQYETKGIKLSILLLGKYHDFDTINYFKELCQKGNGIFYDMRYNELKEILVKEASD